MGKLDLKILEPAIANIFTEPADWIDQLTIAGTPDDWQPIIDRFVELGVQSVVLVPLPNAGVDELAVFAQHLNQLRNR